MVIHFTQLLKYPELINAPRTSTVLKFEHKFCKLSQVANYLQVISSDQMNSLFGALADPTRRNILERLTKNDLTITEIARSYDFALPTISKHLSVLERAQLIKKMKVGREYRVHFESQTMKAVGDYISFYKKFWTIQIDNLEKFLAKK